MALLTVDSLTKRFGDLVAVDDANFAVEDGEFVSILGPSGSGKSTILRMVAGFESPTEGAITLSGTDLVGTPPFERDVNMVFQNLALFPHLTVAENIGYGLKQKGVSADERRARSEEMLEMVHLEGYGDRDPSELSGGEQQRVALARALVNEPALVLFDEPLSSLDRKLRQHMQEELQRIQAETGITFLYVTHDQEVALSVSDRLVVLNDGRVEQVGPVEELYDEPTSQFVADFIGDVNSVPAEVVGSAGTVVRVDAGTGAIEVPNRSDRAFDTGDSVAVCVRPHELFVDDPGTASQHDAQFVAEGVVRNRSYQGSDSIYTVETDSWGRLSARVRGGEYDMGDEVAVGWHADAVHLFPHGTGSETSESAPGETEPTTTEPATTGTND
jgi:spermidine/putrescine transport system ATP-binding protein